MFTEQNRVLYTTAAAQSPGLYPDLPFSAAEGSYTCLPPVAAGKYQVSLDGTDWLLFLPSDLTEGSLNADPAAGKAWTERDGVVSYLDFRTITPDERSGLVLENTVNAPYEALKVFGKSGQKAQWNQAEGMTTQIQETGYNLLDCEAEWLPAGSDDEKGITNIVTGKGSVSFDFADNDNYNSFLENQKAIHLKAGSYYVSGNLESGTLDSVGFSGISEPIWGNCNGVITVPEEGDYKFYIYPFCLSQTLTISNLMIVEGDTSKTYQEYEYSKPSPAYPSELTSHISAGSYQIPTENGIYEVTLTEDLRGLDDTYRDKICFDSISGTGYLEQNTQKHHLKDNSTASFSVLTDDALHFAQRADIDKAKIKANQLECSHFKFVSYSYYNGDNIRLYLGTDTPQVLFFDILKEHLDITDFSDREICRQSCLRWLNENDPIAILPRTTPLKTVLTFTKVESSTLPVLPWTAYGKQLIPFEPYTTNGTGSTTKDWPAPPFVLGETYYFGGGVCDDETAINSNNSAFIILKDGVQVYNKSPNRAITITEDLLGADTVRLYTNSSLVGKTVTQFTGELGSSYSGSYEPFNPTPPESITPSSDYPQKFYDLSNVTVTSRGKNLFSGGNITLNQYANNVTEYVDMTCLKAGKTYTWRCDYEVVSGTENDNIGNLLLYNSSQTKWVRFSIGTAKQIPVDWDFTENTFVLYGTGGNGQRITNITKSMFVEGDTIPFVDKYRCTSAEIPLSLGSISDDKDYLICDGNAVKKYQHIRQFELDANLNRCVLNTVGSETQQYCWYFIKFNDNYDTCKYGTTGFTSHGFDLTILGESYNYKSYIRVPWSALGFTSTPTTTEAGDAMRNYCSSQKTLGTPVTVQYVLNTPVETDYSAETWAQELLKLKTAQYYTCLSADKQTGGMRVLYPSLTENSSELSADYLLTSDGEKVVTNDGKTVIQF